MNMMTRFSLYGFLKNLDFSQPFLILFYLSLGLSFLQIGILVSFLNICVNIMEIPSGAIADIYGRKSSMLVSLSSYIIAFTVFAFSHDYWPLFIAAFFYAVGDAFRTGTHKAMIFDWLRTNNRLEEKTKVYGFTRSWSKYGSALSVVISAAIVIVSSDYRWIFLCSIIPYVLGIWNMSRYPSYLNSRVGDTISITRIVSHTFGSVGTAFRNSSIRKLIIQSMGFEGVFEVTKDYLQPILKAQALALMVFIALPERESTAIVVGTVYFVLYIISASASRRAHLFAKQFRSEDTAIIVMIFSGALLALLSSAGFHFKVFILAIAAYIANNVIQNFWRPILVAQYDDHAQSHQQATILSIESQTKTIGITIIAPVAGYLADNFGIQASLLLLSIIMLALGLFSLNGSKKQVSG
ncbi:MAG TPA: MFS transporter [Spirochaetota bacterium]|nr:MFS transporter [Spirochaetota bacterium]